MSPMQASLPPSVPGPAGRVDFLRLARDRVEAAPRLRRGRDHAGVSGTQGHAAATSQKAA